MVLEVYSRLLARKFFDFDKGFMVLNCGCSFSCPRFGGRLSRNFLSHLIFVDLVDLTKFKNGVLELY